MKKSEIKRTDFKESLITQVIMRIDYEGSIIDLPDLIKAVRPIVEENGYTELFKGKIGQGQIDIRIDDPEADPKINYIPENRVNFFFFKEERRYQIQINESFLLLIANLNNEVIHFDEYGDLVILTLKIIKKQNGYLDIKRIGLRKKNVIISDDKKGVEDCFENGVFSDVSIEPKHGQKVVSNYSDHFEGENSNTNYKRYFDVGKDSVTHNVKYRFVIDIDSYKTDIRKQISLVADKNEESFGDSLKKQFIELNSECFNFFISSCKMEYIKSLLKEETYE